MTGAKMGKPERIEQDEAARRAAVRRKAQEAAASLRRRGVLLNVYRRPEVIASMLGQRLVTVEELRAAGVRPPRGFGL